MHSLSYKIEFILHMNEVLYSYEKMGTMTCFEKEAERNLEMVYYTVHLATRKVFCDHIVSNAVATKRRDNQSVAFSPFNMMEFLLSLFSFFSRFSTLV